MTKEAKMAMLKDVEDEKLLEYFIRLVADFNPCDFDKCETYEIVKQMIIDRMKGEGR